MEKKDLKVFKELLLKKKASLLRGIDHIAKEALKKSQREAAGDLSAYSLHMADMATDNYDREFALGLADNEQKILHRIEAAFERIEQKNFGLCDLCGKKVSKVRLKAVPYAELCVPCQEKQEKKKR
ncbi:MAG: TraR/DksA family transcriptional regulator [Candidatus Omnitrophota bacterium]